jgi:SulP family sulfate permease
LLADREDAAQLALREKADRVLTLISQIAPFASWLRKYRGHHLRADLIGGLTVAVVAVPQSMAYALIAGLPVQYGLYASIFPTVTACLWGSSAHLITGPTTAVSLVVVTSLSALTPVGVPAYIELAFLMALIVGVIQIAMGIARLGALLDFVSHSVIIGFSAGAAVLIGFKQLPNFLGLHLERGETFLRSLVDLATHVSETHLATFLLGVLTIAVIVGVKLLRPVWPGTLIAMLVTASLVALLDLDAKGVAVVGVIPSSLPPFHWPVVSWSEQTGPLIPSALAIAMLGLVEAASIAKAIASQTHQRLNLNQEFIGQGLANLVAGLFSGYPGSGSFTRSAVNFRSGGKTPMSGVISGLAVAVTLLLAAPWAATLPIAALAGVLLVIAVEMIKPAEIRRAVLATRNDAAVLVITFLATILLSIEFAVFVGVALSIGLYLKTTSHPRIYSTVPDLISGKLVGASRGRICCQMDIVRIEGSLFFGSSTFVLEDLQRRLKSHRQITCLLIRMHQVNNLDASGVHVLEQVVGELKARGGGLYFSGVNNRVFQVFKNSGLLLEVGDTHIRSRTGSAIRQAMRESFCPLICAACEFGVFHECPELKRGNWETLGKGVRPRCARERIEDTRGMKP